MKNVAIAAVVLLCIGAALPAAAVCPPGGGYDETSEDFSAAAGNWIVATATPGTVGGTLWAEDLLITEVSYTANNQEFVEIYNPTNRTISLDNYYLSDDANATGPTGYWRVVLGMLYTISTTVDFNVTFPAGLTIASGQAIVIYMGAANGAAFAWGNADFEVASSTAVPDMVPVGNVPSPSNGLLTNGSATNGEMVILYRWDGVCDLVCDVAYVGWGNMTAPTASHRVDKTGISMDGVDEDAIASTYYADTPVLSQSLGQVHAAGSSLQRVGIGAQALNGNGCHILAVPAAPATWGGIKTLYR